MGRKLTEVNLVQLYDLVARGWTIKEIAKELDISHVTVANRLGKLQANKQILNPKFVKELQFTSLQFNVLESITPDKIKNASLIELTRAVKLLKQVLE